MNRVVHFEIAADNPEQVGKFYHDALGWEIKVWEGGSEKYWLVTTGPKGEPGIDGGIMYRHLPQAVINTITVESLEAALAKIKDAGGKIIQGPYEIPGVGQHAYCADPEGNLFGVLQPSMEGGM